MFLVFTTNGSQTAPGWKAHYITGPSVGINENNDKKDIVIYPNPANNFININNLSHNDIIELKLFNINGRLVKNIKTSNKNIIRINTIDLISGIYFIHIIKKESIITRKISIIR